MSWPPYYCNICIVLYSVTSPDSPSHIFTFPSLFHRVDSRTGSLPKSANARVFSGTVAGSTAASSTNGVGSLAGFRTPQNVAIDASGSRLFVADTGNALVRLVTIATGQVTTFSAAVGTPAGVAIDSTAEFLYVSDSATHSVRRVAIAGGSVTLVAGGNAPATVNGVGAAASFNTPADLVVDRARQFMYVAEFAGAGKCVRRVELATRNVTTVVSLAANNPWGITVDSTGAYLYVTVPVSNLIVRVTIATGAVSNVLLSFLDGVAPRQLGQPTGITIDSTDKFLYVTEQTGSRVSRIALAANGVSGGVTTIGGGVVGTSGTPRFADAYGTAAGFANPFGVAIDATGQLLYVADRNNHRVRFTTVAAICARGSVCLPSVDPSPCPGGTYCASTGLSAPTGNCTGGYYCPAGSTGVQGVGLCARGFSCPSGSERITCDAGLYCPLDGSTPAPCAPGYFCALGSFTVHGGMLCILLSNTMLALNEHTAHLCFILTSHTIHSFRLHGPHFPSSKRPGDNVGRLGPGDTVCGRRWSERRHRRSVRHRRRHVAWRGPRRQRRRCPRVRVRDGRVPHSCD